MLTSFHFMEPPARQMNRSDRIKERSSSIRSMNSTLEDEEKKDNFETFEIRPRKNSKRNQKNRGLKSNLKITIDSDQDFDSNKSANLKIETKNSNVTQRENKQEQLPSGWDRCKDSYGRVFYHNEQTKRSCWRIPKVVEVPSKFRPVCTHSKLRLINIGAAGKSPAESSTPKLTQSFVVTLESDRDSLNLFTAMYNQELSDFMYDKPRHEQKSLDVPTLAVCHKRAKMLKLDETDYAEFINTCISHGDGMFSQELVESNPFKKWIKPKNKGTKGKAKVIAPLMSCPPLRISPQNGKKFTFDESATGPVENNRKSKKLVRRSSLPKESKFSLARRNSQIALEYRMKKQERENEAKKNKAERDSNFGDLPQNVKDKLKDRKKSVTGPNKADYEVAITPVPIQNTVNMNMNETMDPCFHKDDGNVVAECTIDEPKDQTTTYDTTITLEETVQKIEKMRLELVHVSNQMDNIQFDTGVYSSVSLLSLTNQQQKINSMMNQDVMSQQRKGSLSLGSYLLPSSLPNSPASSVFGLDASTTQNQSQDPLLDTSLQHSQSHISRDEMKDLADLLENEKLWHMESKKLLQEARSDSKYFKENLEMTKGSHEEALKEISRLRQENKSLSNAFKAEQEIYIKQNDELKALLAEFEFDNITRQQDEENAANNSFLPDDFGEISTLSPINPSLNRDMKFLETEYKRSQKLAHERLLKIKIMTDDMQSLEKKALELETENKELLRMKLEQELSNMPLSIKKKIEEMEKQIEAMRAEKKTLESEFQINKESLTESKNDYQDLLIRLHEIETKLLESEEKLKEANTSCKALKNKLEKQKVNNEKELKQTADNTKAYWESVIRNLKKEHNQVLFKRKRKHTLALTSAVKQVRTEMEARLQSQELENKTLQTHSETLMNELRKLETNLLENDENYQRRLQEIDTNLEEERVKSESALTESLIQREIEAIQIKRKCAFSYLNLIKEKSDKLSLQQGFSKWSKVIYDNRSEEIVDVYGTAMDRINAASKIALFLTDAKNKMMGRSFHILRRYSLQPSDDSSKVSHDEITPADLISGIRQLVPSMNIDQIVGFVSSLNKNDYGKIARSELFNVLNQGQQNNSQTYGKDFLICMGMKLTKVDAILRKLQFVKVCRYWRKWRRASIVTNTNAIDKSAEFLQHMERHALREEVKALHSQLAASKAEAWSFKRKLLSQFEWEHSSRSSKS